MEDASNLNGGEAASIGDGARKLWSRDEEVRIDLHALGTEMIPCAVHGLSKEGWISRIRELARMDEQELAKARVWSWGEDGAMGARSFRSAVSTLELPGMRAGGLLRAARRRWAQVMALTGALGEPNDMDGQFCKAANMCCEWMALSHPDLGGMFNLSRPLGEEIAQAQRGVCAQAMASLLTLGVQGGSADPMGVFGSAVSAVYNVKSRNAFGRLRGSKQPWSEDAWHAQIESIWIGLGVPPRKAGERTSGVRL